MATDKKIAQNRLTLLQLAERLRSGRPRLQNHGGFRQILIKQNDSKPSSEPFSANYQRLAKP
ncbi:MAG: hypothetical protein FD164_829 [Nitrospirae bacterium]|nr:MAG: hypothetical protein FD164_829 [Nitrospirota bacterium]